MGIRFLNLVVKCGDGLFSLHRIDPCAHLFYKSAAAAAVAAKKKITKPDSDELRLPPPVTKFKSHRFNGADLFARFGNNEILHADGAGHISAYDTSLDARLPLPNMIMPKGLLRVVVSSAGWEDLGIKREVKKEYNFSNEHNGSNTQSLYVMDLRASNPCSFEQLSFTSDCWVWRPLPSPPFLHLPGYKPSLLPSCAVHPDGRTIYLSPSHNEDEDKDHGIGTYTFDTVTLEWCKASDWVLPFYGNAEYVPELGWFGLSRCSPYHMCAVSSLGSSTVECVWPDLDLPESMLLNRFTVVNLGSGRLCTVKYYDDHENLREVVVFTGVKVQRSFDGKLEFIRHKSKRYNKNNRINCVV